METILTVTIPLIIINTYLFWYIGKIKKELRDEREETDKWFIRTVRQEELLKSLLKSGGFLQKGNTKGSEPRDASS